MKQTKAKLRKSQSENLQESTYYRTSDVENYLGMFESLEVSNALENK